ncbi:N-methyl-D-aspartate receptor NMDAR2C subunit [Xenophilus arseniciresistens]|uniref:N-methyl-D-aspartate receptor NMDAR2C subunit n=1 Tax=Xenophilus arseniciresistens TaxID=1283306 RepID=A0AAE3N883_9BURK|nr:N-methyl-D-aspartate receptor NMDAR2C subunit [Xenophilus arseniciresistens]MDA7416349.1 N-methyl-D-aspartate receptor NMDAR2C subunit [Xenophilus arseniciresistens]
MTLAASPALHAHWQQAWQDLGLSAPEGLFEALAAAWSEPWRHYHTLQHLGECLDALARERALARRPGELALGLFFHDAVYALQADDNEARSAEWAVRALQEARVPADAIARVHALVMATCHQATAAAPIDPDAQLLVDIDLAILGAAPARFAQYEAQIRREYAHVPPEVFEPRRRRILGSFLARDPIYQTPGLHARCEAQARVNLTQAIAASGTPG